ncbi:MAG: hypothetical protein KGS10_16170 [Chloroflexi bacterium]|nr:hypothetical protein [Chloroflexota bacterium]
MTTTRALDAKPTLILASPRIAPDALAPLLRRLCALAVSQQHAPILIDPVACPWVGAGTYPTQAGTMLNLIARTSNGELWLVLDDTESEEPAARVRPIWASPFLHRWREVVSARGTRAKRQTVSQWSATCNARCIGVYT